MTTDDELAVVTAAISGIEAILAAVKNYRAGAVSAPDVIGSIATLHANLGANNMAADAALARKSP